MDIVSIIIPTFNRNESLKRALASACAQTGLDRVALEILVVDNSPDANARAIAMERFDAGEPVCYHSEPNPGVSNARNVGVRAARGRWIAFLDDDEEALPTWIASLVGVARKTGADAVFAPVEARAEGGGEIGLLAPYFSRRIARPDASDITDLAAYLGTNNSMFDRARCLDGETPFDTSLNEIGGEDSLLLKSLVTNGRRFAFAAEAGVLEWTSERRLNWAYIRKRKFLSGQIRVFVHHLSGPRHWPSIPLWMAVGLVQFCLAGLAALLFWPLDKDRAARASATACGGLGKLFWTPRFRPALYGTGLIS